MSLASSLLLQLLIALVLLLIQAGPSESFYVPEKIVHATAGASSNKRCALIASVPSRPRAFGGRILSFSSPVGHGNDADDGSSRRIGWSRRGLFLAQLQTRRSMSANPNEGDDKAEEAILEEAVQGFTADTPIRDFLQRFRVDGAATDDEFEALMEAAANENVQNVKDFNDLDTIRSKFYKIVITWQVYGKLQWKGKEAESRVLSERIVVSLKSLEGLLKGNKHAERLEELLNGNDQFVESAVTVNPRSLTASQKKGRNFSFSLVLGSSGSGKVSGTVVPWINTPVVVVFLFKRGKSLGPYSPLPDFFVMFQSKTMFSFYKAPRLMTPEEQGTFTVMAPFDFFFKNVDWTKMTVKGATKNAFVKEMQTEIADKTRQVIKNYLENNRIPTEKVDSFLEPGRRMDDSLNLVLVLDECGDISNKDLFDDVNGVKKIIEGLNQVAESHHVIFAGTGLDKLTTEQQSNVDVIKFRMQPWTSNSFKNYVEEIHKDKEWASTILSVVDNSLVLRSLTTNARCAKYLADTIKKKMDKGMTACRTYSELADIVEAVSNCYISSNGLRNVYDADQREAVIRAVLVAYDEVMAKFRSNGEYSFPDFDSALMSCSKNGSNMYLNLARQCWGLVDIHVETTNTIFSLVRGKVIPLTISPALSVVFACFAGQKSVAAWDWTQLEVEAGIGELMYGIRKSEYVDPDYLWEFLPTAKKLPGTKKGLVTVPASSCFNKVLLNGNKASFADVISPYGLLQVKYTTKESPTVYFLGELGKMGVTRSRSYTRQQTLLLHLIEECWKDPRLGATATATATQTAMPATRTSGATTSTMTGASASSAGTKINASVDPITKAGGYCPHYPFGRAWSQPELETMMFPCKEVPMRGWADISNAIASVSNKPTVKFVTNGSKFSINSLDLKTRGRKSLELLAKDVGISKKVIKNSLASPKSGGKYTTDALRSFLKGRLVGHDSAFDIEQSDVDADGRLLPAKAAAFPQYIKDALWISVDDLRFLFYSEFS